MFSKITVILILLITSFSTNANGWSGEATITGIYGVSTNIAIIKVSNYSNPTNCNVNSAGHILIDTNAQKDWFSMILSAYMAQKKVNFYIYGDCKKVHWKGPSYGAIGHIRLL